MAKGGTAAAKKPQSAPQSGKPKTGPVAVASNKPGTKKAAPPPPEPAKRARHREPAGTKQVFMLTDGTEVPAVWKGEDGEERLCCEACGYKFPVRAQAAENAIKRKEKLVASSQQTFRHFAKMLRKNAAKLGEPLPSNEEIAQLMLAAANEEDTSIEEELDED